METIKIDFNGHSEIEVGKLSISRFLVYDLGNYDCLTFLKKIATRTDEFVITIELLGDVVNKLSVNLFDLLCGYEDYHNWHIPVFILNPTIKLPTIVFPQKEGEKVKFKISFIGTSSISPKISLIYSDISY
jgi:hypothetical protein